MIPKLHGMWKCIQVFKMGMLGNMTPPKEVCGGNAIYKKYRYIVFFKITHYLARK
jgi:hypothetical protein